MACAGPRCALLLDTAFRIRTPSVTEKSAAKKRDSASSQFADGATNRDLREADSVKYRVSTVTPLTPLDGVKDHPHRDCVI